MSKYILCQVKQAKLPYYIENISTNIYSIEELCFYFYHNIYLLDETIINEELCFWIRDALGLKKLAQKLYPLLDDKTKVADFILLIFKEINYLSLDEFRRLNQQLQKVAAEPLVLRQKLKGDYLMGHGKIVNAIHVYQTVLQEGVEESLEEKERLGSQFIGAVCHNMGCAYARLFQMEEAISCFAQAYDAMRTGYSMKSYLYAIYMERGIEAFEQESLAIGVDEKTMYEMMEEIETAAKEMFETKEGQRYAKALECKRAGNPDAYHQILDEMLCDLTGEYHRNTGY